MNAVGIFLFFITQRYYVYIMIIVLHLQHTRVHYMRVSYEKVKNDDFSRAPLPQKLFLGGFARKREKILKFRAKMAIK